MKLNWRYFSFYVLPPQGSGRYSGKKREVEVYSPFLEAAWFAVGAAEDETVLENKLSESDRAFRTSLCSKTPKSEELVDFFSGMQRCLKLGVPIRKALEMVIPLARTPFFRGVIGGLYQRMGEGDPLSEAMRIFPKVFDVATVSLIQAGEKTGDLRPIFADIATVNIRANSLAKKIRGGMMYPLFVLGLTMVAVILLGWKVVPEMAKSFKSMNMQLPLMTRAIVFFSETLRSHPYLLLIPISGGLWAWKNFRWVMKRPWVERLIVVVPLFGPIVRGAILVRSLRSLALLLHAGVSTKDCFEIVAEASGHRYYTDYFRTIGERAMSGEQLPSAFLRERTRIPKEGYDVASYIKLGAFVQDIPGILRQYADQLDEDVQAKAEALPRLIEPVLIMALTVVVGGVIMAIYLPYFNMLLQMMKQGNH